MAEDCHDSPERKWPYKPLPNPPLKLKPIGQPESEEKIHTVFELTEETGVFAGIRTYCEVTAHELAMLKTQSGIKLIKQTNTKKDAHSISMASWTWKKGWEIFQYQWKLDCKNAQHTINKEEVTEINRVQNAIHDLIFGKYIQNQYLNKPNRNETIEH